MSDPSVQLDTLRALRDAASDPAQRAALDAAIAAMEAQVRTAASIGPGAQTGDVTIHDVAGRDQIGQQIGGEASVGAAVAGDVQGDVQTGGVRHQALIQVFLSAAGVAAPNDEQRELLDDYLADLARRCDQLLLRGVVDWERKRGKAPDFTLSQVYITLASQDWVTIREGERAALEAACEGHDPDTVLPQEALRVVAGQQADGRGFPFEIPTSIVLEPRFLLQRPLLLTEELSRRRHLVLLGGPGSGKSTFLRHLAVALARADEAGPRIPGWEAGLLLPVYASLGGFAAWLAQHPQARCDPASLWRYLLVTSEHETLVGLGEALKRAFRRGRLLLMLDGLDEVADPVLREKVAAAVAALADRHEAFVVVTCRVRSFVGAVAAPFADWGEPVHLAPFTLGQISHFVRGWYGSSVRRSAFSDAEAQQRAEALIGRFSALATLHDLGATPLLLTIITILHFYEGKLPEDRADLYEDMVQLLLTRWTQQRREAGAPQSLLERLAIPGLKETQLRQTLGALAYRAHQGERSPDGRGLLEQSAVRDAFTRLFQEFGLAPGVAYEQALVVLAYLEEESGLLLHEGGERYAFPHLTYEEYLAGTHLVAQDSAVRPLAFQQLAYDHWRADPARWREVILLALGHAARLPRLETVALWLQFLVSPHHGERQRDTAELHQAALFGAEGLADIGGRGQLAGVSTVDLPALWVRLANLLAQVIEGNQLPAAERVRAGVHLGTLGDPRPGVCDLPPRMVQIEGGAFVIGITPEEAPDVHKQWLAYWNVNFGKQAERLADIRTRGETNGSEALLHLPSFELARYPVTNTQYRLFIEAGGYNGESPWWSEAARAWFRRDDATTKGIEKWQRRQRKDQPEYWDNPRFGAARLSHPVVGVSWYEAMAFCRWLTQHLNDGYLYRLSSEAEWEFAARGGERRTYPWGPEPPELERANYEQQYNGTSTVGCFPRGATPEGILDLAGNVWEWTRSEYRPYPYDPADGREDADAPAKKRFTLLGGGWHDRSVYLRASVRSFNPPDFRAQDVGFRLARHRV